MCDFVYMCVKKGESNEESERDGDRDGDKFSAAACPPRKERERDGKKTRERERESEREREKERERETKGNITRESEVQGGPGGISVKINYFVDFI